MSDDHHQSSMNNSNNSPNSDNGIDTSSTSSAPERPSIPKPNPKPRNLRHKGKGKTNANTNGNTNGNGNGNNTEQDLSMDENTSSTTITTTSTGEKNVIRIGTSTSSSSSSSSSSSVSSSSSANANLKKKRNSGPSHVKYVTAPSSSAELWNPNINKKQKESPSSIMRLTPKRIPPMHEQEPRGIDYDHMVARIGGDSASIINYKVDTANDVNGSNEDQLRDGSRGVVEVDSGGLGATEDWSVPKSYTAAKANSPSVAANIRQEDSHRVSFEDRLRETANIQILQGQLKEEDSVESMGSVRHSWHAAESTDWMKLVTRSRMEERVVAAAGNMSDKSINDEEDGEFAELPEDDDSPNTLYRLDSSDTGGTIIKAIDNSELDSETSIDLEFDSGTRRLATLFPNGTRKGGKVIQIPNTLLELLELAGERLGMGNKAKRLFNRLGGEVSNVDHIRANESLFVSQGEDFEAPAKTDQSGGSSSSDGMFQIKSASKNEWVSLNVGGKLFSTTRSTLCRDPNSMLANMFQDERWSSTTDANGAFLIDRSPEHFQPILNFLRTGEIILNPGINLQGVLAEAHFFFIEEMIEPLEQMIYEEERERTYLTRKDIVSALIQCSTKDSLRLQGLNLSGVDLSKLDLRGVNMQMCDLSYTNMRLTNLDDAQLQGSNMKYCSLEGASLLRANMSGCVLERCNLRGANMEDRESEQPTILEGANLKHSLMEDCNMSRCNLRAANLRGSNMENSSLRGADLAGANLEDCNLRGVNLHNSNLIGSNLRGAYFDIRTVSSRGV